jgi:thermitase
MKFTLFQPMVMLSAAALINAQPSSQPLPGGGVQKQFVHQTTQKISSADLKHVPGEIIIKIKETAAMKTQSMPFAQSGTGVTARLSAASPAFNRFVQKHGVSTTKLLVNDAAPKSGAGINAFGDNFDDQIAQVKKAFPVRTNRINAANRAPRLDNVYKVVLNDRSTDLEAACRELEADPSVEYASPNHLAYTNYVPTDPLYAQQWAHPATSAPQAWDIERGQSSVVVAVVDCGIDFNHEDLAANMVQPCDDGCPAASGYDFVDIDVASYIAERFQPMTGEDYTVPDNIPMDFNGHGTHCAGIVAAVADNGKGVSGVAPQARLMAVRAGFSILYDGQEYGVFESDDIANAIRYAADNGADIISMSFGGDDDPLQRDAIAYAASMGVALIAGAGNSASAQSFYPAAYPNVISVAAFAQNNDRAWYSNFGSWVDIAAPGGDQFVDNMILSTVPLTGGAICDPSGYRALQGTSMATPYAAGVAALMLSHNPQLTPDQVEQIMKRSTDRPASSKYIGTGMINTFKAVSLQPVDAGITITDPAKALRISAAALTITGTVVGSDAGAFRVLYGEGIYPTQWTQIGSGSAPVNNATLAEWNLTALQNEGLYTIRVVVNAAGDSVVQCAHVLIDRSMHPGWPKKIDPIFTMGAADNGAASTLSDIDGDGVAEILVRSNYGMYAFRSDGSAVPGWPQPRIRRFISSWEYPSVSAADIDNDGQTEIVSAINDTLYLYSASGVMRSGFPVWLGDRMNAITSPTLLADLDNDGTMEIIFRTYSWVTQSMERIDVYTPNGTRFMNFPYVFAPEYGTAGHGGQFSHLSAFDIDKDGRKEIIGLGTKCPVGFSQPNQTSIFVWNYNGTLRSGYPIELPETYTPFGTNGPSPVIADIDNDGTVEIGIFIKEGNWVLNDGQFAYYKLNGTRMAGWPVGFQAEVMAGNVTLGDLDRDGMLETVFGTYSGSGSPTRVYAFRSDGTLLPNWPVVIDDNVLSQAIIADIDGDAYPEVMVGSENGILYAWSRTGAPLSGFPKCVAVPGLSENAITACPAVGDVDGDGTQELIATSILGDLCVWDLPGTSTPLSLTWPMNLHDSRHSGDVREVSVPQFTSLPGRIQAEDYKAGGEGVGYHDLTAGNSGGAYKNDNVDIQATTDAGGGYNVGWTQAGEWLAYNVNVQESGTYKFTARLASGVAGTKTLTASIDGAAVATFSTTTAAGWQSWINVVIPSVSLTAGNHQLRLTLGSANLNLNYLDVEKIINLTPVANAGADQKIEEGSLVTLDGRLSSDPDNGPQALTYLWKVIEGDVTLNNPTGSQPTFTAVFGYSRSPLVFSLTVFDGDKSSEDMVQVGTFGTDNRFPGRIQAEEYNLAYDVTVGNTGNVYRNGNVDIQPCTDAGAGYNIGWTAPTEYLKYSIRNAAPAAGKYRLTLRVASGAVGTKSMAVQISDDIGGTGTRQKTVTFTHADGWQTWHDVSVDFDVYGFNMEMWVTVIMNSTNINLNYIDVTSLGGNVPPIANAGQDYTVVLPASVRLDGTGSYDPDNGPQQPFSVGWVQLDGPVTVTLSSTTSLIPVFTPTVAGTYRFRLRIFDGLDEALDEVAITATSNENLLINPDFANGGTSWTAKLTAPATGSITFTTGAAKFAIDQAGALNWHAQLYQAIPVTAGAVYNYSFTAKKSSVGTRTINFVVETDATPYTKDKDLPITIDGTAKTYSGTFTASSSRSVRIEIQGGLSDLDFEVDDFVVTKQ